MKIDVITVWPMGVDYPLYRRFIRNYRSQFNEVIIAFTKSYNGFDFRPFIKKTMETCKFMDALEAPGDWRDLATNVALGGSTGDNILFLEQDFMILSPTDFFRAITNPSFDMTCYREGTRLHPAMIRVRSDLVRMTKRDFATVPDKYDHFWTFFQDLDNLKIPLEVMILDEADNKNMFHHLAGFTHNYNLCISNDLKSLYKKAEFHEWNQKSIEADVEQEGRWMNVMEMVAKQTSPIALV